MLGNPMPLGSKDLGVSGMWLVSLLVWEVALPTPSFSRTTQPPPRREPWCGDGSEAES